MVFDQTQKSEGSQCASSIAPELVTGDWINSEPLSLKNLRGRVVLIEFGHSAALTAVTRWPLSKAGTIGTARKGSRLLVSTHASFLRRR